MRKHSSARVRRSVASRGSGAGEEVIGPVTPLASLGPLLAGPLTSEADSRPVSRKGALAWLLAGEGSYPSIKTGDLGIVASKEKIFPMLDTRF